MGVSNASQLEPDRPGAEQTDLTATDVLQAGTEMLILFDGRVLVHNLTPELRAILQEALGGEAVAGVSLNDCHSAEAL